MGGGSPRIAIVAGEASGDALGAALVQVLSQRLPGAKFAGIAGPKMQSVGVYSAFPMEKLAVRGYLEVLKSLRELLAMRRQLKQMILRERPDVLIGIDAPDFNLGLELAAKRAGIPTIHYVSPSIWAWRGERIHKIKRATSDVLCLFPFEKPLYDQVGANATYVGHPLADEIPLKPDRAAMRETLGLSQSSLIFALLPGSRRSELDFHAELFVQTALRLNQRFPTAQFLVPLITRETREQFETALYRHGAHELPLRMMFGHAHDAMVAADAILVASGTATLEAALVKRPHVITYRLSNTTYRMVKKKMHLPYVGLPNVLAGRFLVPELLQDEATPANLAQALANCVEDRHLVAALVEKFEGLHDSLRCNAAEKAAEAVMRHLQRGAA